LDAAQRAWWSCRRGEPVLILGEAGCGKTTVALHRLRALRLAGNERFRAACIVPNEGLRRLIEALLHRLGLDDVETWTWEKFASRQARRVFPDLRRRGERGDAVQRVPAQAPRGAPAGAGGHGRAAAPAAGGRDGPPGEVRGARDLHALFGERVLMDEVAARAGLPLTAAAEAVEHTRVQFTQSNRARVRPRGRGSPGRHRRGSTNPPSGAVLDDRPRRGGQAILVHVGVLALGALRELHAGVLHRSAAAVSGARLGREPRPSAPVAEQCV